MANVWTKKGVSTLVGVVMLSSVPDIQIGGNENIWGPIAPYINSYLKMHIEYPSSLINLGAPIIYAADYIGSRIF